jgi:hypothetical protein
MPLMFLGNIGDPRQSSVKEVAISHPALRKCIAGNCRSEKPAKNGRRHVALAGERRRERASRKLLASPDGQFLLQFFHRHVFALRGPLSKIRCNAQHPARGILANIPQAVHSKNKTNQDSENHMELKHAAKAPRALGGAISLRCPRQ